MRVRMKRRGVEGESEMYIKDDEVGGISHLGFLLDIRAE